MDNAKNNLTAPAGLPEKEWFTLPEIAQRWGCRVDDVLHFGISSKLQICYLFNEIHIAKAHAEKQRYECSRTPVEIALYDLRALAAGEKVRPTVVFPPNRLEAGFFVVLRSSESGQPKADDMKASGLLVMRDERDRFEQKHRIGAYAGTMPSKEEVSDKLDTRKEKSYLQIIRILLAEAKIPEEPYKAAEVLQAAASKRGLSMPAKPDTIAEKLKAAQKLSE